MGLQGRLEDEVWDKLAALSAPPPAPKSRKPRAKGQDRRRAARSAASRATRSPSGPSAGHVEFRRRLLELRGLLRDMQAGSPVNGVTPGVTSTRLRRACDLVGWLRASANAASRKELVELNRLYVQVNLVARRYPTLLAAPTPAPPPRVVPTAREWQPIDVSKIAIGPESSRWFMDPVNSK